MGHRCPSRRRLPAGLTRKMLKTPQSITTRNARYVRLPTSTSSKLRSAQLNVRRRPLNSLKWDQRAIGVKVCLVFLRPCVPRFLQRSTVLLVLFCYIGALSCSFYVSTMSMMNGTHHGAKAKDYAQDYYIKRSGNIHKTAPHHASFKALWETKWRTPVCIRHTL